MMPIAGQVTNLIQPKYALAFAMAVIATGMWHLTSLFPDASFSFFAWARVWQVIALPFLFIPINTAAYSDLSASALINVARNLQHRAGAVRPVPIRRGSPNIQSRRRLIFRKGSSG